MLFSDDSIIGPWVCARVGGDWPIGRGKAIGRLRDGKIVGGILYEDFNGANIMCHIAGEGRQWLNREFLWAIFHYPFEYLGASRMTAPVASVNQACRRFVEHLGFTQECVMEGAHPQGDIIIYRLKAEDCRWLELKNGKRIVENA